jgi:hypothetical protein
VAALPAAVTNKVAIVTDGTSASDCTLGGGSSRVLCHYNGSAWAALGDGNSGAAPSFADITAGTSAAALVVGTGGSLAATGSGTITATDLAAKFKTRRLTFMLGADNGAALTDSDDQATIFDNTGGDAITITGVYCESDGGTPRIQLQRDDGAPANILTDNSGAGLNCSTSTAPGAIDTNEDNIAAGNKIDFVMVAAGGVAKRVTVTISYTVD